jgi:hypothetical protein
MKSCIAFDLLILDVVTDADRPLLFIPNQVQLVVSIQANVKIGNERNFRQLHHSRQRHLTPIGQNLPSRHCVGEFNFANCQYFS